MEESNSPPRWVQTLLQRIDERAHQQEQLVASQNERIQRMEELMAARNTPLFSTAESEIPPEPVAPATISEPVRRPRARLPDPAMYAGNVNDWSTWRITMENKLAVDGEAIGAPQDQFAYVFSRLEKVAWKNAGTFVRVHREHGTAEALLDYLEKMYGDPNARSRAARRLHQIRQGEEVSFQKFLPRIEREFADAGALDWPDEAKRQIMLDAINKTMIEGLMSRGIPKTFTGLIDRLHEISTDRDSLETRYETRRTTKKTEASRKSLGVDEMEWTPTVQSKKARAPRTTERAKWVSEREIERRREKNTCLRCGREGCRIARCPYLPAKRPEAVSAKKARTKKARDEDESSQSNEDDTSADEDSGKE